MRLLSHLLLCFTCVLVMGQQPSSYCYTMQVALASGEVGFEPFRGAVGKDSLHFDVKQDLFQNSSFEKGNMVLENAGERESKYDGQKFRLNYMMFKTVTIGYKSGGIADTVIDESTYKKFNDYVQALYSQCFSQYKLIEGAKDLRVGQFARYYISPVDVALDGGYIDFAKMIDKPFIVLDLDGFFSKAVHITITFYYPTSR